MPFFWTVQFGKSIRYSGHATSFDEVIVQGTPEELKFAAYYAREGKVLAVAALGTAPHYHCFRCACSLTSSPNNKPTGMDPLVSAAADLLHLDKMPSVVELKKGGIELKAFL